MFGEDILSESPRVSSPWDPFLSSPPSEPTSLEARKQLRNGIPKLVPEVEEGNVEYKLKLTDISPARFARLVTQLKWRLLEGGGQAYYELGVADSGALIGLSRSDLEQSLETLEMMAGEIGASVIVVKEIEVPPAMVALADKVSAYIDPETGEWTEKMSNRRRRASPRETDSDTPSGIETDFTDTDEASSLILTPSFPPQVGTTTLVAYAHRAAPSYPDRPIGQSSPSIFPIDDDLALFSMEPEPSLHDDADVEDAGADILADVPDLSLDIEITPVYKPRPVRQPGHRKGDIGRPARRLLKNKDKKPQVPLQGQSPSSKSVWEHSVPVPNKQDAKALLRRIARDKRREDRRKTSAASPVATNTSQPAAAVAKDCEPGDMAVVGLDALHAGVQSVIVAESDASIVDELKGSTARNSLNTTSVGLSAVESREPRLIVEALVVRKMSLEEEFLDFGNLGALSIS